MKPTIRLRFAPSPTGGLHIGGVRTLIYNYLYVQKHQGSLIVRIEDTDRSRWVPEAEHYIYRTLAWLGIRADESPEWGGAYAPYRQSERCQQGIYQPFADQLLEAGYAYYAFDTAAELQAAHKADPHFQYDAQRRMQMQNQYTLGVETTKAYLQEGRPFVVRLRVPEAETLTCTDVLRGVLHFQSSVIDDKVLVKEDGLPTYHLAAVVDDYLMKISHVLRGEEWLPSLPAHVLLWRYLGWEAHMPQWIHLPLILNPDGKGKLSKRGAALFAMPVFPLAWEGQEGFKEKGFLPEALINTLALLSWKPEKSTQEVYRLEELMADFDFSGLQTHSARFDYAKAVWLNGQHIRLRDTSFLLEGIKKLLPVFPSYLTEQKALLMIAATQERYELMTTEALWAHLDYFWGRLDFEAAVLATLRQEFTPAMTLVLDAVVKKWADTPRWDQDLLAQFAAAEAEENGLKTGRVQLILRLLLVGAKKGISVWLLAFILGQEETLRRLRLGVEEIKGAL